MDPLDPPTRPASSAPRRALIVDDEPDILETLQSWLELAYPDLHVVTAKDPAEATLAIHENRFDLIVSDYRMPYMDGIEFLQIVAQQAPGAFRLLITAFPDPSLEERARSAGVSDYLTKPLDLRRLRQVMEPLLRADASEPDLANATEAS